MDELKKQAEELGIKVDGRWSEDRLREEIEQKMSAQPKPVIEEPAAEDPVTDPAVPADPVKSEPEPSVSDQISLTVDFSDHDAFTVKNLQANPMRSLGLASYGERTFKVREGADALLMKKIQRGVELGLIKVLELE